MTDKSNLTQLIRHFSYRIAILMTVIVMMVAAISLFYEYRTVSRNDQKNLLLFAGTLREDVLRRQDLMITEKTTRFSNDDRITSIRLLVGENQIFSEQRSGAILQITYKNDFFFGDAPTKSAGSVEATYSYNFIFYTGLSFLLAYTFVLIIALVLFHRFLAQLKAKVIDPIQKFAEQLSGTEKELTRVDEISNTAPEIELLQTSFNKMVDRVEFYQRKMLENTQAVAMSSIASQVSHDIRSPLSALNMIFGTLDQISEEKRVLIKNSVKRINDIANDLLDKSRSYQQSNELIKSNSNAHVHNTKVNVVTVIKNILMEKELLALNKINFEFINQVSSDAIEIIANEIEISRVISNLINNSMEAFCFDVKALTPPLEYKIIIRLVKNEDKLFLTIQDNGVGIPESALKQIGSLGFTHGKGVTGNGLGLYHATQTLKSLNGDLTIDSQYGKGTTVTLIFPYR